MTRRGGTTRQKEGSGGLLALLPLVMVFAAIAFLAVGAGRMGQDTKSSSVAEPNQQTADITEADQAAAAAIVAISLARVAPALPEDALEPPKPKPQQAAAETPKAKKPATAARETQPNQQQQAGARPNAQASVPAGQPQPPAAQPAQAKPNEEGVLARIGSYAPSPTRIVGAVSDGVSKIARYIPGL